ncbi:CidA/LrgA family holin-like protein [Lysinibacillus xylanilyticus]|uniref:CidA/LrgA family holin-like protein n=1 Tax=Lysinibacillus TaxID=400634 RepID=UPI002B249881|nr:CidA/LrgA family holin-like protein [Lysinibacillus xylanilyticus]MEB2300909.1 CidA/LrgA family holin-like protein [Lysinibacillus xylanilyticus]
MKIVNSIVQIGYLYVILFVGNSIARLLHLPIPGSIIGLVLLFLLLQFHIIKLEWIELGAGLLLSELLLFFIPSAIGVIDYTALFGVQGVKAVLVIVLSAIVVMFATGFTAQLLGQRKKGDTA